MRKQSIIVYMDIVDCALESALEGLVKRAEGKL
jgi:hypothetical protein